MHYAAVRKDAVQALTELVGLGANAGVRDADGNPLSFYASLMGNDKAAALARSFAQDPKGVKNSKGQTRDGWIEETKPIVDKRAGDFTMIPVMKVHPEESEVNVFEEGREYGFSSWPDMDDLYRAMHEDDASLAEIATCTTAAAYACAHACSAFLLTGAIFIACVGGCSVIGLALCIQILHSDHSPPPACPVTYEFYELGVMYTVTIPCPNP